MSSRVVPTDYKEPNETTTSLGYASSILSGNTKEGGLRSLTYKSVYASQLVEELEMAKRAVVPAKFQLLRIIEKDLLTELKVQELRKEISSVRNLSTDRNKGVDEKINALSGRLEQELEKKAISPNYSQSLKEYCGGSDLNQGYKFLRLKTNVQVQRMEDVEGFDSSMYQRAEERRAEEKRTRAAQAEAEAQDLAMSDEQDFDMTQQSPEGIFLDMPLNGLDQRDFVDGDERPFQDSEHVLMHDNFSGIGAMDSPQLNQQMNQQMHQQMNMDQSLDHEGQLHASHHGSPQVNQMQPYQMDSMSFPMGNQPISNQEPGNIGFSQGYPMTHNVEQYNAMNQLHGNPLENPYMQNQPPF